MTIVFRPLTITLRNIYHRWSIRPFWALCLLLLIGNLISSGPLACIVHCVLMGETRHTHHLHAGDHVYHETPVIAVAGQATLIVINERGDHSLCTYLMGLSSDSLPSALTIAVVLTSSLALQIVVGALRHAELKPHLRLIALPPPPEPPRTAHSCI